MKKFSSILVLVTVLFLSFTTNAQSKAGAEYFKGKWSVLLKGVPGGNAKMIFVLESRNDSIIGVVQDSTGTELTKISSVELKDSEINLFFTTQGYDVNLLLTKKDEDNVTGSLMSMFDAEGVRIKPVAKEPLQEINH